MNEKFLELPEDKKQKIINAGLQVFSQNEYRRASTELIAAKAGISKGLLFYYFQSKRTLYTFLFEWAVEQIKAYVVDSSVSQITDFFEYCEYTAERKCQLLYQNPYIMDFVVRAFYSRNETVSDYISMRVHNETASIYGTYFDHIDFSKFREDVNPQEVYRMLVWMVDGYMHERQRAGQGIGLNDVMAEFRRWSAYFKRLSYKEEYLK